MSALYASPFLLSRSHRKLFTSTSLDASGDLDTVVSTSANRVYSLGGAAASHGNGERQARNFLKLDEELLTRRRGTELCNEQRSEVDGAGRGSGRRPEDAEVVADADTGRLRGPGADEGEGGGALTG